jgi:RNA polymerase sigma-70 factor, ECF subfamily
VTGDEQDAADKQVRNQKLETLLSACALGDRGAFEQLYRLTSPNLYSLLLRILNSEAWAQDCLQDAYVKIWNNAHSYRPYLAAPMTWMMTIARNQALDQLRRRRYEVALNGQSIAETADNDPPPLENLMRSDQGRLLKRCLDQLGERQREMIALAYYKGLTHDELARQSDTPLGSVKTWIRRGLEALRRCLEA